MHVVYFVETVDAGERLEHSVHVDVGRNRLEKNVRGLANELPCTE